jgi:hypothetical protein
MPPEKLPSPWAEFLRDVDRSLSAPVDLHCLGGFVVSVCYGLKRPTADVDVLSVTPGDGLRKLLDLAGKGTDLARKYRLYIDHVTIATAPESYEARLRAVFADQFKKLRLFALDPYDLVLAKLERNIDVDRDDVRYLATAVPLDVVVLRERYVLEMRSLVRNPAREDLTLDLWVEIIQEARRAG